MTYQLRILPAIMVWVLLICGQSFAAAAPYISGNQLYDACGAGSDDPRSLFCLGYITGMVDAVDAVVPKAYCFPNGVTTAQLRDMVMKVMRDHPDLRNAGGAEIGFWAVAASFGCAPKR